MHEKNSSFETRMFRLPLEAYTSDKWYQEEQMRIFNNTWQFAGYLDDLKKVGDHICTQAGKSHIIVTCAEDGSIQAMHSVCRHRGNIIDGVSGDKKKFLKCPYHSWSYDLKGKLMGTPESTGFEPFEKESYNLKPAGLHVWKSMVFVHPDPHAQTFEMWIHGVEQYMGPHKPELLEEYPEENNVYLVNCNWKIFAENYMDGYHLDYLHSKTLYMYDHSKQRSHFVGPHWTFFEPLTEDYLKNMSKYGYKVIDHIPKLSLGAYVHLIFPNLGIVESESTWTTMRLIPLSPNKTLISYRTKVMPSSAKAAKWFKSSKAKNKGPIKVEDYDKPLESYDFMIEDMYVCENIQGTMESGQFEAGPLHLTKESSITQFQQAVLNLMHTE